MWCVYGRLDTVGFFYYVCDLQCYEHNLKSEILVVFVQLFQTTVLYQNLKLSMFRAVNKSYSRVFKRLYEVTYSGKAVKLFREPLSD
jgi:hypothetical protein